MIARYRRRLALTARLVVPESPCKLPPDRDWLNAKSTHVIRLTQLECDSICERFGLALRQIANGKTSFYVSDPVFAEIREFRKNLGVQ